MTDKKSEYESFEMEIKANNETYSNFTYVQKNIGVCDFTTGIFYPGKDYDYGSSEMTELEIKMRIADIILEYNRPKMRGVNWMVNEQSQLERELDNLLDQLLERKKKHE